MNPVTDPNQAPRDPQGHDEINPLEIASVLLRRRRIVVGVPFMTAAFAAAVVLIVRPTYRATVAFMPESEPTTHLPSGVANLAAQLGVIVPTAGATTSPQFYADLLGSRTVADEILLTPFSSPRAEEATESVALLDILEIEGKDLADRLEKGRRRLAKAVTARVNVQTGMVGVSVETRYAELSAAIANFAVDLLNRFNLETRRSRASEQRQFIELRVAEVRQDLRTAEDALRRFLEQNREFRRSPQLQFEHDRLQWDVSLKQELHTTLARSYEEARIREVNDTPLITVIDSAVAPVKKARPRRKLVVVLAFGAGAMLGLFWAFTAEYVDRARRDGNPQYQEVVTNLKALQWRFARRASQATPDAE